MVPGSILRGRISAAESCKDGTRAGKAPGPVCNSVVGVQNFSVDHRNVRFCELKLFHPLTEDNPQ